MLNTIKVCSIRRRVMQGMVYPVSCTMLSLHVPVFVRSHRGHYGPLDGLTFSTAHRHPDPINTMVYGVRNIDAATLPVAQVGGTLSIAVDMASRIHDTHIAHVRIFLTALAENKTHRYAF